MKKWIRWKGLMAFAAALVVILLGWLLVVDAVVRRTIETVGTRVVGVKVDVADADLSLFPTGLTLSGLAVTNPDAPMRNAVEVGRMKMDLDPGYLIKRKVIVNTMLVEGLTFNTARQRSGEVPDLTREREKREKTDLAGTSKAAVEKVCGQFNLPSLDLPDVKAILAKESLASIALSADLEKKITAEQARWEKELTRLADEKTLKDYRTRIDKLKAGSGSFGALLGATREVQQLQEDIRKDLRLLKQAQATFTTDYKAYQKQVRDLTLAPLKDMERIVNKYSLSPDGLANLSTFIFGQRLCGWVQTASAWYRKIKPTVGQGGGEKKQTPTAQEPLRGKGQNIRFAETPPMPDFLIRNLQLNARVAAGDLTGKAENITLDQHILGSPMTFAFLGKAMQRIDKLSLIGSADYVKPDDPKTSARLAIKGLVLDDLPLVRDASFPLALKTATSDLDLNLATAGDGLDGTLEADFGAVEFVSDAGKQNDAIGQAIDSAIAGVERFSLRADVSGTLANFTVAVASDLDTVLQSAVGNLVKKETAKFQAALKKELSDRLQGPLAQTQGSLAGLDQIGAELNKRMNLGDDLLKGLKLK